MILNKMFVARTSVFNLTYFVTNVDFVWRLFLVLLTIVLSCTNNYKLCCCVKWNINSIARKRSLISI